LRLIPIFLPDHLRPHVHAMWVFESATGLPSGDARIVVPNGRAKLIIPWRNGLTAEGQGRRQVHPEGNAVLIGVWDKPTVISSTQEPTVSIGIEFVPGGLRRFVDVPIGDLEQRIEPIGNVLGALGDRLARQVAAAETIREAVDLVSRFLDDRFRALNRPSRLASDEAIRLMVASGFKVEVGDLERQLGYSRRHLLTLFQRDVGMAPKRLISILAFERLYRAFSQHRSTALLRDDALDVFYDQSHFIRHFRRFTGTTPSHFADLGNEFGRLFYRQTPSDILEPRANAPTRR